MAIRSLPDNDDFLKKLETLILNPKKRKRLADEARNCAIKTHPWDVTANKFIKLFEEIEILDRANTWDRNPRFKYVTEQRPPQGLNNEDFVHWCYTNILGRVADEKGFNDWMANLTKGGSRDSIEHFFRNEIIGQNMFEEVRWNNSLKIRGIKSEECIEIDAPTMPGILI